MAAGEDVLARVTRIVTDGEEPQRDEDVWAMLDRQPDRYHPKTGELVSEGRAKPTKANVKLVLEQDERLQTRFRHNEFTGLVEIDGEASSDVAETDIACFLSQVYDLDMATATVAELIRWRAARLPFNPVADYLRGLRWDGAERLSTWLTVYLGAAETNLNAHIGVKWAISAVARVMRPGYALERVRFSAQVRLGCVFSSRRYCFVVPTSGQTSNCSGEPGLLGRSGSGRSCSSMTRARNTRPRHPMLRVPRTLGVAT